MTAKEWADHVREAIKGKPVTVGHWIPHALRRGPEHPELLKAIPMKWLDMD
jgi:ABC-type proline/glycine betaine transport system substrate-binding protein